MKILFLEPFFGGSHRDFALGFSQHSSHDVDLVTLPARYWKWRMQGAALYFIQKIKDLSRYDLIFTTDMMDLSDFIALAPGDLPPIVMYFHENQLSYPLGPHGKKDFSLGFTNIFSALATEAVFFNSNYHCRAFLRAAKHQIRQMPDFKPDWIMDSLEKKTRVLYPGCRFNAMPFAIEKRTLDLPLIIWNHRWDYDKNPEEFFKVLKDLKKKGIGFYLALMGEQLDLIPKVFTKALEYFSKEILVSGYIESPREYKSWLAKGSVVVSTSIQENFGISIVEAVRQGCFPLLPKRLSYPEIMPEKFHGEIIYKTMADLQKKLETILKDPDRFFSLCQELSGYAGRFSWEVMAKQYDKILEKIK
ncbi:MAG: glycosyl transferase family 1 [Desulfobacteraceae bacterium 4572_89]|nr:MAG: glycosyl transferase family 1 [Desulfobacteraceae bacterium 4572_89]